MYIEFNEPGLSYSGNAEYAVYLVESLRSAYEGKAMPTMLSDLMLNLELALSEAGALDEQPGAEQEK